MKRIQSLPFILTAGLLLAACSPTTPPAPMTPAPTLTLTPAALTLTTGQQRSATLVSTDTTAVTVEGAPSGLSATISGPSVTITDTAAAPGSYPLTLTATGPGGTATATLTVTVTPPPIIIPGPDFTLILSPNLLTLPAGASGTTTAAAAPVNGFSSALTYTVTGVPAGLQATFDGPVLTVSNASTPAGTYGLVVTVAGGGVTHAALLSVTVPGVTPPPGSPDFTFSASPSSLSLLSGAQGTVSLTTSAQNGFSAPLTYSVSGAPAGLSTTLSGSTLSVQNVSAAPGTYPLNLTATGGGATHGTAILITVPSPQSAAADFTLTSAPGALTLASGASGATQLTITPINGFMGPVSFTVAGAPSGLAASVSGSTLNVTNTNAPPGTYSLVVTGTSGTLSHTATVSVVIPTSQGSAPDFSLSASPASRTLATGDTALTQFTVTPSNGFTGAVSFSVTGAPAGVSASFSGQTLTIANSSATPGVYSLTITATSGMLSHTTTYLLTAFDSASANVSLGTPSTVVLPENGSVGIQFYHLNSNNGADLSRPYTGALDLLNQADLVAQGFTVTQQNGKVTVTDGGQAQPNNYSLKVRPIGTPVTNYAFGSFTFNVANSAKLLVADAVALDTTGVSSATYTIQGNNIGYVAPFAYQLPYEGQNNQASRIETVTTPGLRNRVETLTLKFGFAGFDTPPVHFDLMVHYKDGSTGRLPVTLQYKTDPPNPFHRYPIAIHARSPQEQAAIDEVNAIRASGTCGGKQYGSLPPVQTDAALDNGNREYAANQATFGTTRYDQNALGLYALLNGYLDDSLFFGLLQLDTTYDQYANPAGDDGKAFADGLACKVFMVDTTNMRVSVAFYPFKPSPNSSPTGGFWNYVAEAIR